ncbi:50S ribosomal protein L29 [Candidatus Kaiserbacteria bacterium]|nr:50S ribosomal protein L29 [Candidatus Kaiserbacteria bacterium]
MTKKDTMTAKTDQELIKLLADTRETLRAERFSAAGARAKDSNAPRKLRKTVARILTEQSVRALRSPQGEVGRAK